MHDLGYHHAIRGNQPDADFFDDPNYKRGYEAGQRRGAPKHTEPESSSIPGLGSHGMHAGWESLVAGHHPDRLRESMNRAAYEAKQSLRARGVKTGRLLGAGLNGHVYQSETPGQIIKIDKGDNEARLANFISRDAELSQLRGLPRYHSAENTGVKDQLSGKDVHAIHREDITDLPTELRSDEGLRDSFRDLKDHLDTFSERVTKGIIRPQDYAQSAKRYFEDTGIFDHIASSHPNFVGPVNDLRRLIDRGIVPCDLHLSNWGRRPSTGEFVMRDMGCYAVVNRTESAAA